MKRHDNDAQGAEAVAITDRDLRVRSWSAGAERLTGFTAAEAVGANLYDLVQPELSAAERVDAAQRARTLEHQVRREWRRRKDGSDRLIESRVTQLRDRRGRVNGVVIVARDVTAEASTAEAARRVESILAAMSEGVVVHDATGRIVACNAAAETILGVTREQISGRSSLDPRWRAVHEDGSPFPGEAHPAMVTLRTGEPCDGVLMGVHMSDGGLRWISINARPVRSDGGGGVGVVCTFTDVTASRAAQRRLEDTIGRLDRVLAASHDVYWDSDWVTGEVFFSPAARALLGLPDELDRARTDALLVELTHPEDRGRMLEDMQRVRAAAKLRIDIDVRMRWADGVHRWMNLRGQVVERLPDGRPARITGVLVDVDERQRLREELEGALAANRVLVGRLEAALGKVLGGLVAVCAWCKSVREEDGRWVSLERYVEERSDVQVTHGMCPRCYEREVGEPPADG